MKKKIIAVLLSACMLVSACPTGAFAMSDEETNTYTATGDVMQGERRSLTRRLRPEETATPEETAAPEETPTPAPEETPAPVEVEAQATPAAGAEETAPAKQSAETGIALTMLLPDDKKPTVDTYRFYGADGKELTEWQQTVAKGEVLLEPPAPTKENARFVGWYVGETPLSFGTVATVSGKEVTVTAKFEEYSYVYFMNEDGTQVVYYTAAGVAGETVGEDVLNAATAKVELTMSKDKGVVGWSTTQGSDTPETITFAAGVTYVYPVVKTGFWVTFNTDGGDYVAPQFRMETLDLSTVTPPATATRLTVGMTQTATRLQRFPEQLPSPHTGQPIPKRNTPLSIGRKMQMITSIPQRILKRRPAPQTAQRMLKQNLILVLPHRRLSRRPLPVTVPQS